MTLWCTVAKLWCYKLCAVFFGPPCIIQTHTCLAQNCLKLKRTLVLITVVIIALFCIDFSVKLVFIFMPVMLLCVLMFCLNCWQYPVFSEISQVLLQVSSCSSQDLQVGLSPLSGFSGLLENPGFFPWFSRPWKVRHENKFDLGKSRKIEA